MNQSANLLLSGANTSTNRRAFLRRAGLASAVAAVAPAAAAFLAGSPNAKAVPTTDIDAAVLNFALNLEYLEGEYYCYAASGAGLASNGSNTYGMGTQGVVTVKANPMVPWSNPLIQQFANEIAVDELTHVNFLRGVLYETGLPYYAEPDINLLDSFNGLFAAATNTPGATFDPFASDVNFLIGAFIFEDVGVTAYSGASALITNPDYLAAAAGILAVEAYHAAGIRTLLFNLCQQANAVATYGLDIAATLAAISAVRDTLSGGGTLSNGTAVPNSTTDQGIIFENSANLVPSDTNGVAFERNTREVLNIVYGSTNATRGGFFPSGMNGLITS